MKLQFLRGISNEESTPVIINGMKGTTRPKSNETFRDVFKTLSKICSRAFFCFQGLTILANNSISGVLQGFEYALGFVFDK